MLTFAFVILDQCPNSHSRLNHGTRRLAPFPPQDPELACVNPRFGIVELYRLLCTICQQRFGRSWIAIQYLTRSTDDVRIPSSLRRTSSSLDSIANSFATSEGIVQPRQKHIKCTPTIIMLMITNLICISVDLPLFCSGTRAVTYGPVVEADISLASQRRCMSPSMIFFFF